MIYDTLENFGKYFQPASAIFRALCFAAEFDPSRPDGKYEIESETIFALVSSYQTSPASHNSFEIHRKYADVQIVVEGEERLEVWLSSALEKIEPYDEARDRAVVESPEDPAFLVMRPGCFAVLYPDEAHRPGCNLHGEARVRKIVVKVHMVGAIVQNTI